MKSGKEELDQDVIDSLKKRYQLYLSHPTGEINVYVVLDKNDVQEGK